MCIFRTTFICMGELRHLQVSGKHAKFRTARERTPLVVLMIVASGSRQTFQQFPKPRSDWPDKIMNNSVNWANFEKSQRRKCLRISSGIYDFFCNGDFGTPCMMTDLCVEGRQETVDIDCRCLEIIRQFIAL